MKNLLTGIDKIEGVENLRIDHSEGSSGSIKFKIKDGYIAPPIISTIDILLDQHGFTPSPLYTSEGIFQINYKGQMPNESFSEGN